MKLSGFSPKQRQVLTWWLPGRPGSHCDAIICDGAVRSGKTLSMALSFFLWAMACFDNRRFGLCGRTVGALRRNVLSELQGPLRALGLRVTERRADGCVRVCLGGRENEFYRSSCRISLP